MKELTYLSMSQIPITSLKNPYFESQIVDNDGFFKIMEERLPSLLDAQEIRSHTRLAIRGLFAQMKQQTFIKGVTEWTATEQESFFKKIQSEIVETGIIASTMIREKIQHVIEYEIWREINDDGKKYSLHDGNGNTMISNIGNYKNFLDTSFLLAKETTIIPLDLRLTVSTSETIQSALDKLQRYNGRYNALIIVDEINRPVGIIKDSVIHAYKAGGHTTLDGIHYISQVHGHYATPDIQLKKYMQEYDINVLPIIDSKMGVLIGILTSNSLVKKEVQYYSATSITRLSIDVSMHREI